MKTRASGCCGKGYMYYSQCPEWVYKQGGFGGLRGKGVSVCKSCRKPCETVDKDIPGQEPMREQYHNIKIWQS